MCQTAAKLSLQNRGCAPYGAARLSGGGFSSLGSHALSNADGGDAPRLRAHYAAGAAPAVLNRSIQQKLRYLGHSTMLASCIKIDVVLTISPQEPLS